ncbi:MAG: hypothetical protein WBQ20_12300, partial [Methyloceanibacter sp.]
QKRNHQGFGDIAAGDGGAAVRTKNITSHTNLLKNGYAITLQRESSTLSSLDQTGLWRCPRPGVAANRHYLSALRLIVETSAP